MKFWGVKSKRESDVPAPTGGLKLDLACGPTKRKGFTGVDIVTLPGVDTICDLEKYPWPWPDNSVDEVYCSHYIEHVTDIIKFMEELYRIMKPGGKALIIAPYYSTISAWQDPTHKRVISQQTFTYYDKSWRDLGGCGFYPIKTDFRMNYKLTYAPDWEKKDPVELEFAVKHYWNVVRAIEVTLIRGTTNFK